MSVASALVSDGVDTLTQSHAVPAYNTWDGPLFVEVTGRGEWMIDDEGYSYDRWVPMVFNGPLSYRVLSGKPGDDGVCIGSGMLTLPRIMSMGEAARAVAYSIAAEHDGSREDDRAIDYVTHACGARLAAWVA